MTMTPLRGFLAGIGVGLLGAALLLKLADLSWLVVVVGVLLLIVAGTGLFGLGQRPASEPPRAE